MKQKKEKSKNDIIMGADPFGIALKDAVKSALLEDGFNVIDITGKRVSQSLEMYLLVP